MMNARRISSSCQSWLLGTIIGVPIGNDAVEWRMHAPVLRLCAKTMVERRLLED
jgi:hypothetical protein